MLKTNKYPHGGFTLIELLVVVLIIGILAAIALPQYQLAVGKAKFTTLKDNARAIKNALDRYYLVNSTYTTNLDDLDVEINSNDMYCYIFNNTSYCQKRISGVNMEFGIGLNENKYCNAFSQEDDIANRICKQETQMDGVPGYSLWTLYTYQ